MFRRIGTPTLVAKLGWLKLHNLAQRVCLPGCYPFVDLPLHLPVDSPHVLLLLQQLFLESRVLGFRESKVDFFQAAA